MAPKKNVNIALNILLAIVLGAGLLAATGIINIQGLLNPDSPNYHNWWNIWQPIKTTPKNVPATCPKTTCEITKNCCGKSQYDSTVKRDIVVTAVPIPASCSCPEDTKPEPAGVDNTAPGGPYKICECN